MKRGIVIFFTLFITAQLLVLPSCKKKEGVQTLFTSLLGTWKETEYATDDNGSGAIVPSEIHNVASGIVYELTFNPDSTGVENSNSFLLPFTWHIVEGYSVMLSFSANDTVAYNVSEITSGDLTLTTTTNLGLAWYYYIKK